MEVAHCDVRDEECACRIEGRSGHQAMAWTYKVVSALREEAQPRTAEMATSWGIGQWDESFARAMPGNDHHCV